jgi:photosystem II stability/assembly factor-like uncharacterized protein
MRQKKNQFFPKFIELGMLKLLALFFVIALFFNFCSSNKKVVKPYANEGNWQAVPLVNKEMKDKGQAGGEGCQVVQAIEIGHTDGLFLLMGTDVGGIFRSVDGGNNWMPCNIGYSPRGNAGFAIDPNNNHRALAVGGNSTNNGCHGLYLTTDQGSSWKHVLPEGNYKGYRSFIDKVEFVKGSFDPTAGYSKKAFWANPAGGIYRSDNGGANWTKVNSSFGNCLLKVNPQNGDVYIANQDGFYKSTGNGQTFIIKLSENVTDIDVVISRKDEVFLVTPDKFFKSNDGGETFKQITTTTLPSKITSLSVSPGNPDFMVICNKETNWGGTIFYSHNGGESWMVADRNNDMAFMPYNTRTQKFVWHPSNDQKFWALGGDWISSSKDGGKSFAWDANGYNGILVGGLFNFNIRNPNLLFVASQDYNGAFTTDNGQTWSYCNARRQ